MFKRLNSNQHYALVVLVFSLVYLALGFNIEVGFFNGPIGPQHWVITIASCLLIFSVLLLLQKNDYQGDFPPIPLWLKKLPFIGAIFIYAEILPYLGFLASTPLLMTFVALSFGAKLKHAVLAAILMTSGCYLLFNKLLDISLPLGLWWC